MSSKDTMMLYFLSVSGLSFIAALLAATGSWHAVRPGRLRAALLRHGVVPGPACGPVALAVAGLEVATATAAGAALATGHRGLTGVVFAVAPLVGAGFGLYLRLLLRAGVSGSCGCTPLDSPVTPASFVPPGALIVAGILGLLATVVGADPDGATGWPLPVAWALALWGLVTLLPATAPAAGASRLGARP